MVFPYRPEAIKRIFYMVPIAFFTVPTEHLCEGFIFKKKATCNRSFIAIGHLLASWVRNKQTSHADKAISFKYFYIQVSVPSLYSVCRTV